MRGRGILPAVFATFKIVKIVRHGSTKDEQPYMDHVLGL